MSEEDERFLYEIPDMPKLTLQEEGKIERMCPNYHHRRGCINLGLTGETRQKTINKYCDNRVNGDCNLVRHRKEE
jgi:hypothetical protein